MRKMIAGWIVAILLVSCVPDAEREPVEAEESVVTEERIAGEEETAVAAVDEGEVRQEADGQIEQIEQNESMEPMSPDQELTAYADTTGGQWISEVHVLGYDRSGSIDVEALSTLSQDALLLIHRVGLYGIGLKQIPDLHFLPSLTQLNLDRNEISDVSAVENLEITDLTLSENPIEDMTSFPEMRRLIFLDLGATLLTHVPDMSALPNLAFLALTGSSIISLDGIESIAQPFTLDIRECDQLSELDALLETRVRELHMDQGNYERLESWFDEHLGELQARQPDFTIEFQFFE